MPLPEKSRRDVADTTPGYSSTARHKPTDTTAGGGQ
jgi:hypothetical protein